MKIQYSSSKKNYILNLQFRDAWFQIKRNIFRNFKLIKLYTLKIFQFKQISIPNIYGDSINGRYILKQNDVVLLFQWSILYIYIYILLNMIYYILTLFNFKLQIVVLFKNCLINGITRITRFIVWIETFLEA